MSDITQTAWNIIGYKRQERAFAFNAQANAIKSITDKMDNATSTAEFEHYQQMADGYLKSLPEEHQGWHAGTIASSSLSPIVRKQQAFAEQWVKSGKLTPDSLSQKYAGRKPDEISEFELMKDMFQASDFQWAQMKNSGIADAQAEVAIKMPFKEVDTATGKKLESFWAVREGPGKRPTMYSETELGWEAVEKKRGLDTGHIAQHQGNIQIDVPVYKNGLYGINRFVQNVIPGQEKMSVQFVPDPKYGDEARAESRAIRSENRGEAKELRKEHRDKVQGQIDELAQVSLYRRLHAEGVYDEKEMYKTRAGQMAIWTNKVMGPRGLFSTKPALAPRYVSELYENQYPNVTAIIDPKGEHGWRFNPLTHPIDTFTTLFNQDFYMEMPGGGGITAIPNSKRVQVPTADPTFNAEVIVDYNYDPPRFRSASEGGRFLPPELNTWEKVLEYYKEKTPSEKEKDNWKFINPPDLLNETGKIDPDLKALDEMIRKGTRFPTPEVIRKKIRK